MPRRQQGTKPGGLAPHHLSCLPVRICPASWPAPLPCLRFCPRCPARCCCLPTGARPAPAPFEGPCAGVHQKSGAQARLWRPGGAQVGLRRRCTEAVVDAQQLLLLPHALPLAHHTRDGRTALGTRGDAHALQPCSALPAVVWLPPWPRMPSRPCSDDRGGTSMKHFCEMIHKSLLREFQYALVWGTSSKHMPQRWVGLCDGAVQWLAQARRADGEAGRWCLHITLGAVEKCSSRWRAPTLHLSRPTAGWVSTTSWRTRMWCRCAAPRAYPACNARPALPAACNGTLTWRRADASPVQLLGLLDVLQHLHPLHPASL